MKRRPSGSSEDEDRSKPVSPNVMATATPGQADRGGAELSVRETRDANRRPAQSGKRQGGKQARELSASPASLSDRTNSSLPWSRSSVSRTSLEQTSHADRGMRKGAALPLPEPNSGPNARLRSPWRCSLLTLATSISAIVLLFTIVHASLHRQQDPKGCSMSYMMPTFTRFSDFDTEHTRFASKYSLYLYRERGVDEDTRVKGIPVLFIPGNAGSYKQVRPIAAEAAHYFHDVLREDAVAVADGKRPLDIFTVDFNEELIAFHGQTLLDQAEYLNEAVAYILALYHNPQRSLREPGLPDPKSVIILGHSMGGVVARTMLRMPNYQENTINTIVTLSAPHARPPISFDAAMVDTYNDINTFWRESFSESTAENPLADVTLVSVAGGGLDTMIPSEYTSLTSLVPDTHGFTVFTSSIPNVWSGMDHLAIMWCDQFRKALVRAIFDIVDVRRPAQTRTQPDRVQSFRKRLLTGMEPVVEKGHLEHESTMFLSLEPRSTKMLSRGERLVLRSVGESTNIKAHVMPIPSHNSIQGDKFILLTDQNLELRGENATVSVLLCRTFHQPSPNSALPYNMGDDSLNHIGMPTKLACKNAGSDSSLLPASTSQSLHAFDQARPFSYLQYELSSLADYHFVAVLEEASAPTPGWVIGEFSRGVESTIQISKGHHQLLMQGLLVTLPADRPMMTEVKIPEVHSTLFAYNLDINRKPCQRRKENFAPLMRQYIAEPYESKYSVNTKGGNINVHGLSPYMPPPLSGGGATEGLSLQLWTDPTCNSSVEISLNVDLLGSAGKLVLRYRTVLASFPLLVVALVLRKQFQVYDTTGVFMSFTQSMDQCIRTSLPAIFLALTFFAVAVSKSNHGVWTRQWLSTSMGTSDQTLDFAMNDLLLGTSDPLFWFLVPLFAIISVGVCIAFNYVLLIATHVFALILSWFSRPVQQGPDSARRQNGLNTAGINQRLITTGLLILMVVTVIPYQFAYMVLCVVQIATCVRALKTARESQSAPSCNFYNYTHSMLVLMLWILPINMPILIVWAHNLAVHWLTPFSTHHNLLAVLGYILLVEMMSTGNMIPRIQNRTRFLTNIVMFALALYTAVYGVTYAYRLHYLVNALCFWLFAIHLSHTTFSQATWARHVLSTSSESTSTSPPPPPPAPHSNSNSVTGIAAGGRGRGLESRNVKKRP